MYNVSLTKADKRLCRELIHVGSERECKHYVEQMKRLTEKPMPLSELNAPYREENGWSVEGPWHKRYIQLFKATEKFDKHIARRYDGISGGSYINCVIDLYCDHWLGDEDISRFSEDVRQKILFIANREVL